MHSVRSTARSDAVVSHFVTQTSIRNIQVPPSADSIQTSHLGLIKPKVPFNLCKSSTCTKPLTKSDNTPLQRNLLGRLRIDYACIYSVPCMQLRHFDLNSKAIEIGQNVLESE